MSDGPAPLQHPAVDGVLQALTQLDELPVAEHVAVFEAAHEELRRTLDRAGEEPGPDLA